MSAIVQKLWGFCHAAHHAGAHVAPTGSRLYRRLATGVAGIDTYWYNFLHMYGAYGCANQNIALALKSARRTNSDFDGQLHPSSFILHPNRPPYLAECIPEVTAPPEDVVRPWDRLVGGLVLGSEPFARRVRQGPRVKERELPQARELSPPVSWNQILGALQQLRGETWESFSGRYADWGRDPPLWLGRRQGRLGLAALGALAGGLDYAAVSVAVRRFAEHLKKQPAVQQTMATVEKKLVGCWDLPPYFTTIIGRAL